MPSENHQEHEQKTAQQHNHADHGNSQVGHGGNHGNHGGGHSGHEEIFRRRFWWSTLLSVPVLVYSPTIQGWLGFTPPQFPGSQWISFLFSLIIFLVGGVPFLNMARPELKKRQPGMMTLISLAITVALVYSVAAQLFNLGTGFFWELVTLIDVMLLGHWMEMRSIRQASGALDELARLMPDTANRILENGEVKEIPVSELQAGDRLLVRPGESVPADGEIIEGESSLNESMITGESRPVSKAPGDEVIGGRSTGTAACG